MTMREPTSTGLLTPAEAASLFAVDPKTLLNWSRAGTLSDVRTPGGSRRYLAVEVHRLRARLTLRWQNPATTAAAVSSGTASGSTVATRTASVGSDSRRADAMAG